MLLGVQVPGFPAGFGGMINMSMVESMGQLHHPHPHHAATAPPAHHARLPARVSPPADGRSSGHSPTTASSTSGPRHGPRSPALPAPGHHVPARSRDRYAPYNRLAQVQIHPPRNPNKPLTPFSISDILTGRAARRRDAADGRRGVVEGVKARAGIGGPSPHGPGGTVAPPANIPGPGGPGIVRPWADMGAPGLAALRRGSPVSDDRLDDSESESDEEIQVDDDSKQTRAKLTLGSVPSPLDALLQMTSKTFDGMDASAAQSDDSSRRDQLSLFSKSQPAKKRRKSRTAFSNQQIYELEKRFLYQKYLTPADRDEIAASLGLTNAQVITWFQNRRAKLKRDLEELKADVTAATVTSPGSVVPEIDPVGCSAASGERHPVFGSLEELKLLQRANGHPGAVRKGSDKGSVTGGNATSGDEASNDGTGTRGDDTGSSSGVTSLPVSPQTQPPLSLSEKDRGGQHHHHPPPRPPPVGGDDTEQVEGPQHQEKTLCQTSLTPPS